MTQEYIMINPLQFVCEFLGKENPTDIEIYNLLDSNLIWNKTTVIHPHEFYEEFFGVSKLKDGGLSAHIGWNGAYPTNKLSLQETLWKFDRNSICNVIPGEVKIINWKKSL